MELFLFFFKIYLNNNKSIFIKYKFIRIGRMSNSNKILEVGNRWWMLNNWVNLKD